MNVEIWQLARSICISNVGFVYNILKPERIHASQLYPLYTLYSLYPLYPLCNVGIDSYTVKVFSLVLGFRSIEWSVCVLIS